MMNGDKTVEVRKGTALYKATQKLIDEYGYAEFYVCCTKGKPNLWLPYEYGCFELDEASQPYLSDKPIVDIDTKMNGKVIFKFRCYKVEEINTIQYWDMNTPFYWTKTLNTNLRLQKASCLSDTEIYMYLGSKQGYAIHISDLEIFDKPKELSEFQIRGNCKKCKSYCPATFWNAKKKCLKILTKAPQSWCYVEVDEL